MAEEEVTSQPASDAHSIVSEVVAEFAAAPEPEPQTAEPAPEVETIDPATITIPNRQFKSDVPKVLEKFKGKNLTEVGHLVEETERWGHAKAQEAADARREVAELQARIAAAEQVQRMTAQPPAAPPDPYAQRGIKLDEAIITDPRAVMNTTLDEARRIAREEAEKATSASDVRNRAEFQQAENARRLIGALEGARMEASKLYGEEIPIERWRDEVMYIAPRVKWENDNGQEGRIYDPKAYLEHYAKLKGMPKVSVPSEGNPPVATRATTPHERALPSISAEERAMRKAFGRALGDKLGDALKDFS